MQPYPTDLFGEVVVTLADIDRWLIHIPRNVDPTSKHAAWYVAGWAVPYKIRRAKLDGGFDELPALERRRPWFPPARYRAALEKPPITAKMQNCSAKLQNPEKRPARKAQDRLFRTGPYPNITANSAPT